MFNGENTGLKYNLVYSIIDVLTIRDKNADNRFYNLLWIMPKNGSKYMKGLWVKGSPMYVRNSKAIEKFM